MSNSSRHPAKTLYLQSRFLLWVLAFFASLGVLAVEAPAQSEPAAATTPPCTLEKHVYTCNGPAFQKQLEGAKTVSLQTHSIDKFALAQLTTLITKKLGKTIVPEGSPSELIFLLIPVGGEGMNINSNDAGLATLRVYSVTPGNTAGDLIWAEVFTGQEDLPWPTVVNSLILQFRSHFHIK